MSRIPRHQEHLKTAFTAEATAAARFRAYAAKAEVDGLPNLAAAWRRLAADKDVLAARLLEAAGRVRGEAKDLASELSDVRYEIDVLFPKMISQVDGDAAEVLQATLDAHQGQLDSLETLRRDLAAARGDVTASTGG